MEINISKLNANTDIIADLGADSIDNVSIISHINNEFKIRLDEAAVKNVRTIAELTAVVEQHSKQKK